MILYEKKIYSEIFSNLLLSFTLLLIVYFSTNIPENDDFFSNFESASKFEKNLEYRTYSKWTNWDNFDAILLKLWLQLHLS